MPDEIQTEKKTLHPDVLRLGLVSFLTDVSSEMIFSVFAVFFTTVAGASSALLGLIEGLADFSAASLNYLAGWLSDRSGQRKSLALVGYGFSALAKIILLTASSVAALAVFRVIERLGKSFRGPPRDAWLSAIAAKEVRGYSFGVHKALDKAGAVIGPLIAWALLSRLGENAETFRLLFWIAVVPALLGVLALGSIHDKPGTPHPRENLHAAWRTLSPDFQRYMVAAATFSLAYFSFGFLLLRAWSVGFAMRDIVLLYALFNIAFVIASPGIGRLGDRIGRARIIMLGYGCYLVMSIGFALASSRAHIIALFVLYGIFYAIDEGQSKAFVADLEPERRATAVGVYNFVTGLIYLPASLLAGALWAHHADVVFASAAAISLAAIIVLAVLAPGRTLTH